MICRVSINCKNADNLKHSKIGKLNPESNTNHEMLDNYTYNYLHLFNQVVCLKNWNYGKSNYVYQYYDFR